ncbi:MAG: metal ABC transporter substrate-binding protein [Anaerolineales bacterium]|jgi:ABC-type Zn uptake system ZnuABC Zn-binding protein ZnuA|nr:metal ABC transporter substrate-binding protein [Anaerolineales bacterium]
MEYHTGRIVKSLMAFILLSLALAACTSPTPTAKTELVIVSTTTIVGDVVKQVSGENVRLSVLLPPGTDPHAFEPKPADAARIAEADVVFANGAGLESFLESLLQNAGGNAQLISLSEGIELLKLDEEHEDEAENEAHGEFDPHVWHDPSNVIVWTENIARALSELDPANADEYQDNAKEYIRQLEQLDAEIEQILGGVPSQNRQFVTDHHVFGYFARRYGFEVTDAIIPGFSTLSSPSAQQLAALIDQIQQEKVKAILVGVSMNPNFAEQISRDTGAKLVFVYTGALSPAGEPAATYLQMMEYNAQAIASALK